jgi:hypothetical protein
MTAGSSAREENPIKATINIAEGSVVVYNFNVFG